jgi:hypothetical protein
MVSLAALVPVSGQVLGGHVRTSLLIPAGWNSLSYPGLTNEIQLEASYSTPVGSLYGSVLFTVDELGAVGNQLEVLPGEIFISAFLGPLDVTLGRQIISWGTADGINPTDNINPRDISNFLSPDKLPVSLLRLNAYPAYFMDIEAVFVPTYPEPKLPDLSGLLPSELEGVTFAVTSPAPELESFQAGARANFLLPGVDLSVSYLYAWDHLPDIDSVAIAMQEVMSTVFFGVPSGITLGFNRIHVIGADFAWPVAAVDLRGEAAFFLTDDLDGSDPYVKNPWIHYVVGAGYRFSNGFTANIQLSQKITLHYSKVSDYGYVLDPTSPASLNRSESYYADAYAAQFSPLISGQKGALQSTVMVHGTQRLVDDTLELGLTGIYNFPETYDDFTMAKYGDFMIRPSASYAIGDAFDLDIGANLYFSLQESEDGGLKNDPFTTFGVLDGQDHFFVDITYSY